MATATTPVTILLTAGNTLNIGIGGRGVATLGPGPGANTMWEVGLRPATIGPYTADRTIYLSVEAGSPLTYEMSSADAQGVPNLLRLPDGTTYPVRQGGSVGDDGALVVLVFGDSLVANGFIDSTQSTTAQNWLQHAAAKAGGVAIRIVNGGVSGENVEEQLARLPALLSTYRPAIVINGPNSVNDIDDGFDASRTIAARRAAWEMQRSFPSVRAIAVSQVHPTGTKNLAGAAGASARRWYRAVNDDAEAYATQFGLPFFRAYDVFTNADGSGIRTGYTVAAGDTVHWSYKGAMEFGAAIQPQVARLSARTWEMPRSQNDARNMLGPWATAMQGSNASGAGGVSAGTGATITNAPNGMFARRTTGDSTATGTVTSITSPVGLVGQSAQMVCTLGADAGAIGIGFGHEVSSRNRFDNARANSQAYTYGERIAVSSALCAQVLVAGTSAGSSPDFSAVIAGDIVVDGTVTWLITPRPQLTDTLLIEVDCSLDTLTSGSGDLEIWCTIFDSAANNYTTYINYAGATNQGPWPDRVDTKRRLLRGTFSPGGTPTNPSPLTNVRTMACYALFRGANGAQATIQLHGMSIRKV